MTLIVMFVISALKLQGQISDNCVANTLTTAYSEKTYSTVPVTDQQLDLILKCGLKAPSARNKQPWKFTVIRDETVQREIIKSAVPGNVLIVISGIESESGVMPDFDCGLAAENMFIAAHGLGLGACIYSGPSEYINSKKDSLQIPSGYKAVVALRIGNVDRSVDAVSAATPRKDPGEVINYFE
jgi:nitroreductase